MPVVRSIQSPFRVRDSSGDAPFDPRRAPNAFPLGVRFCLESFASSIRRYFSFCELRANPTFPVRGSTFAKWRSMPNPGGTFRNYANYMGGSCFPRPPLRGEITPDVANIITGLKLVGEANTASRTL